MSISGEYNGKHPTVYQDDTEAYGKVNDPSYNKSLHYYTGESVLPQS